MPAGVIQGVVQNKGLIAEPRDSDQKVLLTQQPCIARDDPLAVAELPAACPRYDHCRTLIENLVPMMVAQRNNGKAYAGGPHDQPCAHRMRLPGSCDKAERGGTT